MANLDIKNRLGVVHRQQGRGTSTSPVPTAVLTATNDVNSMRARLTAISSTTYTSARLDAMTVNDMIYAIRLNDDPTGI